MVLPQTLQLTQQGASCKTLVPSWDLCTFERGHGLQSFWNKNMHIFTDVNLILHLAKLSNSGHIIQVSINGFSSAMECGQSCISS